MTNDSYPVILRLKIRFDVQFMVDTLCKDSTSGKSAVSYIQSPEIESHFLCPPLIQLDFSSSSVK